jgi:lipoate-protein ligase B
MVPYENAWKLQAELAAEIGAGRREAALLLLEHPHTYTFGRRGNAQNLLWDEEELSQRRIAVHWVDRGGDVTYHGPGQLVGYPLLRLAPVGYKIREGNDDAEVGERLPAADYIGYLRKLEGALIDTLGHFGLKGIRAAGMTGVWVEREEASQSGKEQPAMAKIAAIGVKVDAKGVSRHGFALNLNPDMSYWEGIIGCGLKGYQETSITELVDLAPNMQQLMDAVVHEFGNTFGYTMAETATDPSLVSGAWKGE